MEASARLILDLPLPTMFFILFASSARALGVLFGLWGLYFVIGPAPMLRIGLAVILSLPFMAVGAEQFSLLIEETPRVYLLTVPLREVFLGLALGLIASMPFIAILGAGIVIDQYRGDFSPGLQAPENQQVGSFANLKVVMALYLFVEIGGFLIVLNALYTSFGVFAPGVPTLSLGGEFGSFLGEMIQQVFWLLIVVAMPIMVILILIDFGVNMVLRMSNPIKVTSMDFLLKSLVFVMAMPVLVYGVARAIESAVLGAGDPLLFLQELLRE
ncbi:MAG: flagellar biosynthetic protein FliR [Pseudomonadota bacterium]